MRGYEAYPEYRDSGVEWIGIVPLPLEIKLRSGKKYSVPQKLSKKNWSETYQSDTQKGM